MDLTAFDLILINSSAGKDSLVMLDELATQAAQLGILDRCHVVHADLGRVEWKGTRELAERQAALYGLPFHVESRPQGDLLEQVEARGMWPGSQSRYCTSDHKRGQIGKVITRLVKAERERNGGRQVRVLNCLGFRRQESPRRAKHQETEANKRWTNGRREVLNYHPILDWSLEDVWARIRGKGLPYHQAYDLGMSRLSCVFCVFASRGDLMVAARHNRELLQAYVAVEARIGHSFQPELKLAEIQAEVTRQDLPEAAAWAV